MDSSNLKNLDKPIDHLGVSGLFTFYHFEEILVNFTQKNVEPDQMQNLAVSDRSQYCLPMSYLWAARQ